MQAEKPRLQAALRQLVILQMVMSGLLLTCVQGCFPSPNQDSGREPGGDAWVVTVIDATPSPLIDMSVRDADPVPPLDEGVQEEPDAQVDQRLQCADGVLGANEADVDCGGPCARCAVGSACRSGPDCISRVCVDSRCAPARCGDGVIQPGEACDDGDGNDTNRCSATCTLVPCTFRRLRPPSDIPVALPISEVHMGDFDGSAMRDVVILTGGDGKRADVFRDRNSRSWTYEHDDLRTIAVGDIDGDGDDDIVLAYGTNQMLNTFSSQGDGTFTGNPFRTRAIARHEPIIALADFDVDGDLDVVRAYVGIDWVGFYDNAGGSISPSPVGSQIPGLRSFRLADADRDGDVDVLAFASMINAEGEEVTSLVTLLNDRRNGLLTYPPVPLDTLLSDAHVSLATGDIDGDGDIDVAYPVNDRIMYMQNDGTGRFTSTPVLVAERMIRSLALGDVDNDGDLDIAVASSGAINLYLNDGVGTFGPSVERMAVDGSESWAMLIDVNGDNVVDLVSHSRGRRCSFRLSQCARCGDGIVIPPLEQCDDQNDIDQDACHNSCQENVPPIIDGPVIRPRQPWPGEALHCSATVDDPGDVAPRQRLSWLVHDRVIEDDPELMTETQGGDSILCRVDASDALHHVEAQVEVVIGGLCGDGTVAAALGEQCDDGNREDTDSCSRSCESRPACGLDFMPSLEGMAGNGTRALALVDVDDDGMREIINIGSATIRVFSFDIPEGIVTRESSFFDGSLADIIAADLDSDGTSEIAVIDSQRDQLIVFSGAAGGEFAMYPTGSAPSALASGDLTGDGIVDLAVVNRGSGTLTVHPGREDGTFGRPIARIVGESPEALAVGDTNGDGRSDVVVTDRAAGSIVLFLNTAGGLNEGERWPAGDDPVDVTLSDVNGDGLLDALVADAASESIRILLHRVGGGFGEPLVLELGSEPRRVSATDLNGDGVDDLVVAARDSVETFVGRVDGIFDPLESHRVRNTFDLALGDIDGDDLVDLVLVQTLNGTMTLLRGRADGRFEGPVKRFFEGRPTAAVAAYSEGNRQDSLWMLDGSEPALRSSAGMVQRLPDFAGAILAADIDGDQSDDLVYTLPNLAEVGAFSPSLRWQRQWAIGSRSASTIRSGDIDRDGRTDLVVAHALGLSVIDGSSAVNTIEIAMATPTGAALGDVNGDHWIDIVTVSEARDGLEVHFNRADGTFTFDMIRPLEGMPAGITDIELVDLDSDGLIDVLARDADDVLLVQRTGFGGGLVSPDRVEAGGRVVDFRVADPDRDGDPDVIALVADPAMIVVLENDGTGLLAVGTRRVIRTGRASLVAFDVDVDGDLDLGALYVEDASHVVFAQGCQ